MSDRSTAAPSAHRDPDPRRQSREIREALERHDREQLIDILTHVFRHYVMQGDPPAVQRSAQAEDFSGLSFAQIIELLQLRTSVPELNLFEVQGGRVSLRVGGQLVPIEAPQAAQAPLPPVPPPAVAAPAEARPAAAPAAPVSQPPAAAAPAAAPPRQAAQARAVPIAQARPAGAAQAPAAAPAQRPAAKDDPGEDAGGRFTLLEID